MKVLVSGANGFVGRALCSNLLSLGYMVVPAVRRPLGMEGEHIVRDKASWAFALKNCNVVVHLAAPAHVMRDQESDPLSAFRANNVDATIELANLAVAAGAHRFVFMSTIKVNGEATEDGQSFGPDDVPSPQDPYAISKMEAEQGLRLIAEKTSMEVVIIRPPLVYGPGVKANFAALMHAVQRGWPLPLGAVHNQRSLVALGNLVDFIITCATHHAAANQTFLVCDGQDLSTSELVRAMSRAAEVPTRLLPIPVSLLRLAGRWLGKADAIDRLCGNLQVDSSKARDLLGWLPPFSVHEELVRTMRGETI